LNSVREDAVEAEWAIVDPILAKEAALYSYEPGSWFLVRRTAWQWTWAAGTIPKKKIK
jgi:glucose-6-phosphate 1-dehydrogenase